MQKVRLTIRKIRKSFQEQDKIQERQNKKILGVCKKQKILGVERFQLKKAKFQKNKKMIKYLKKTTIGEK